MEETPPNGLCLLAGMPICIIVIVVLFARWLAKAPDTEITREQAIAAAYEYSEEFGRDCEAQDKVLETLRLGKGEYHIGWKREGVKNVPVVIKGTVTDRYRDHPIQATDDF